MQRQEAIDLCRLGTIAFGHDGRNIAEREGTYPQFADRRHAHAGGPGHGRERGE